MPVRGSGDGLEALPAFVEPMIRKLIAKVLKNDVTRFKHYCKFVFHNGINAGLMSVLGDKYHPRTDDLIALVDSDWAADNDTRRSCRGYAIYYYGALICAKSKLDSKVSTSSAEAELHAMILLIHEIDWLTTLYKELGEPVRRPVRVFEDNQACIAMIAEPNAFQSRSKYLQLSKYSVAEKVDRSEIGIEWLSTDQMIADAFTKPEPRALLEKFRPSLVIDVTEHWRK